MTMTSRKNQVVKALQSVLNMEKGIDNQSKFEYMVATNNMRTGTVDQSEIKTLYTRKVTHKVHCGATKLTHVLYHENDNEFRHIVIKRYKENGVDIGGNQLLSEIRAWQKYELTDDADFLCPIMKFFSSKSDKVDDVSETMKDNVIIIAQKAEYVNNARRACQKAEELNTRNGCIGGTDAETRYEQLRAFSRKNKWWDAMGNGGNSGVIFDYSKGYYKAVFIDYAL